MFDNGSSTAAAGASGNTTLLIQHSPTSSVFVLAFVNSAATLVCACLTTVCVLGGLGLVGYRRRRDQLLADHLGSAASIFWAFEPDVERLIRFTDQLKSRLILHGMTDFDLLSYKFRVENGVFVDDTGTPPHQSFVTLKRLEHLFDGLALHLPRRRRIWWRWTADRRRGVTFGSALCRVALATAQAWCDDSAPTVRAVVRYFAGDVVAGQFDARRQMDLVIGRRVLATVPYVRALRLVDDRFLLVTPATIFDAQLQRTIRAVDERLTLSAGQRHLVAITDSYRSVRELCVDVGLVRREDTELPVRPPTSAATTISLLRHLLRLSSGTTAAARRTSSDRRLSDQLSRLYDRLVSSVDLRTVRAAERSRDGALSITAVLTTALSGVDAHFTKTTLEHVERTLRRHSSHLAVSARQTAAGPLTTRVQMDPVVTFQPVVSVEEESSGLSGQYFTAASSLEMEVSAVAQAASVDNNNDDDRLIESAV